MPAGLEVLLMAAKYRKIDPRIWSDEKFVLLSEAEKLVALYCLTSPQVNRIGLFRFSPAMAAEDLETLPPTFVKRFGVVCHGLFWGWDSTAKVLYFPTWWKYNRPDNPNILSACLEDIHDVPATPLLADFLCNSEYLPEAFAKKLLNVTPNVPGNVTPNVRPQEQEQEQEQEPAAAVAAADVDRLKKKLRADPFRLRYATRAVDAAMRRGVKTSEIGAMAEFWEKSGAQNNGSPAPWNRSDLYERIFNAMSGENPAEHWPPPGDWQKRKPKA